MFPDLYNCNECGHPRWKQDINYRKDQLEKEKVPFAQHTYIPIIHRIKLWWSNQKRAQTMLNYRNTTYSQRNKDCKSDFWTGELIQDLQTRDIKSGVTNPMFSLDTDIAFMFSSDGVKVFKSRRTFYIWPLLLVSTKE